MTPEHDDELARELRAMRAEPSPEFARELDGRAQAWLRRRRRRLRMPPLRFAIPAAAAATALVIALAVVGGDDGSHETATGGGGGGLALTVSPGDPGAAGEALSAAPKLDTTGAGAGSVVYGIEQRRVSAGDPLVITYDVVGAARARALLAGRRGEANLPSGRGQLRISTDGIEAGKHRLRLTIGTASPKVEFVEILPGG
jgi:hypothetical protein